MVENAANPAVSFETTVPSTPGTLASTYIPAPVPAEVVPSPPVESTSTDDEESPG